MIKIETEGHESRVGMAGAPLDVLGECLVTIRSMYFSMEKKDKTLAMYLRHILELDIKRGRLFKRFGNETEIDLTQEGMEDTMQLVEDALKDFPEE